MPTLQMRKLRLSGVKSRRGEAQIPRSPWGLQTQMLQTTGTGMCPLSFPAGHSPHSSWVGPMIQADLRRGGGALSDDVCIPGRGRGQAESPSLLQSLPSVLLVVDICALGCLVSKQPSQGLWLGQTACDKGPVVLSYAGRSVLTCKATYSACLNQRATLCQMQFGLVTSLVFPEKLLVSVSYCHN